MELRFGCDVLPLIDAIARSTTSTPASAALSTEAEADAARVVRVEMNRQADLLLQRLHELVRRVGPAQPRHVLDREEMRAHPLQLLRELRRSTSANTCRAIGSRMSPV